jgi:hypothetical protein
VLLIIIILLILILLVLLFPRVPLTQDERQTNRRFVRFLLLAVAAFLVVVVALDCLHAISWAAVSQDFWDIWRMAT